MIDEIRTIEQPTPMGLIQFALQSNLDIDKLKALIEMQHEAEDRSSRILFDEALSDAQAEIKAICPDAYNETTKSKFARFVVIDKAIRPIYIKYGFNISFTSEPMQGDQVLFVANVAHKGGYVRKYSLPVSIDHCGPKGTGVMTKAQGSGNAASYARRYLLGMIFNLAIGEDKDGNDDDSMTEAREQMDKCRNKEELEACYRMLFQQAQKLSDPKLMGNIVIYYNKRKAQL